MWLKAMCLGVPGKVLEIREEDGIKVAVVEFEGAKIIADATITPDIKPGDYVIVHAGMVIAKIDEKEAIETIKLWEEILKEM